MEYIKKELKKIIKGQLRKCQENKTVPSKEVLDTIHTLNMITF